MKKSFINFIIVISITLFSFNLGAQEPDSETHVVFEQFIKGNYSGKSPMLPIIKKGFKSTDNKVCFLAINAFDVGIKRRKLNITMEVLNKPEFKELFEGLLNDEIALLRSIGVSYLLTLSSPNSKSIGLSLSAVEKEADEETLEKMMTNIGFSYSISKNTKDKSLIISMLNV